MEILSDPTPDTLAMPRFDDGAIDMQELLRRLAEQVVNAVMAAVAEMYATGTSTRKVQRAAKKVGVSWLSKDQVSAIAFSLDADIEDLCARPLGGSPVPYVLLDATYIRCRREGRVASTAEVTAIGCDAGGRKCVLGVDVVGTESYDSRLTFLRAIRSRETTGVRLVVSDARPGLVRALGEVFRGAAPRGSAARSTSCVTACARPAPGSSGAA